MKDSRFLLLHNVFIVCKCREKKLISQVIQQKYLLFRVLIVYRCSRNPRDSRASRSSRINRNCGKQGAPQALLASNLCLLTLLSLLAYNFLCLLATFISAFLHFDFQTVVGKEYIVGKVLLRYFVQSYFVCEVR